MKTILKKTVHPSSILSALTGSVCRRVALVVFLAAILLNAAVTVFFYHTERNGFVHERSAEALSLFAAAVDPTAYPGIEALTEMGENLVRNTKVDGGVVISGAGEDRAVFGTVPGLTWAEARLSGEVVRFSPATGMFDIFISPEQSRLPYGVILRLNVAEDWQKLSASLFKQAMLLLAVAVVLSVLTVLIVANQVVRPLATIREVVDLTLNAPEDSGAVRTGISRSDEIGTLARAVDQLLFLTSTTFTDELAAAVTILEKSPHGILTFSEQGHLISANQAALSLFGERNFTGLLNRDPTSLFRFGDEAVDCVAFASRGATLGPGEILQEAGNFPCLIAGDTINRADGTVLRRFLIFVDMRDVVDQVRAEVHRREAAEGRVRELASDLRLMRRNFDACLVITEMDSTGPVRPNPVTLQPRALIETWSERLAADGEPAPARLEIGDLPPVKGVPADLRRLFDTALEVVRLRSGAPDIRVAISGAGDGADVEIVFREITETGTDVEIASDVDMAILLGALGVLCRRQGGALMAMTGEDGTNQLAIRLKVDLTVAIDIPVEFEAA
ncbi:PAS domain-containing protein [Microbaculum sp. FT89]|uniref:PAS domain-containing protein n=1 Tax=Microbaculum sp. FT89 TaxID=3447298 RepID=UPI003F53343F